MRYLRVCVCTHLILILCNVMSTASAAQKVNLLVYPEHFEAAVSIFQNKTEPCHDKPLTIWPHIGQLELVILCRALYLGGLNVEYEIASVPNQYRAIRQMKSGRYTMIASGIWSDLRTHDVIPSSALLPRGSFDKGIYTSPKNSKLLASQTLDEINDFTAVVGETWHIDRQALDCMGIKQTYINDYPSMLYMVKEGRADMIFQNFSLHDHLLLNHFGIQLTPVPNIKIVLNQSTRFFVSKAYPNSREISRSLNRGLGELRAAGLLKSAYKSIGFFNEKVESWEVLTCEN